jgi:hypothetical protein
VVCGYASSASLAALRRSASAASSPGYIDLGRQANSLTITASC